MRTILLLLANLLASAQAVACSCSMLPVEQVAKTFRLSSTIATKATVISSRINPECLRHLDEAVAEVVKNSKADDPMPKAEYGLEALCDATTEFIVVEPLKGSLDERFELRHGISLGGTCGVKFNIGSTYTLLIDYNGIGPMTFSSCSTKWENGWYKDEDLKNDEQYLALQKTAAEYRLKIGMPNEPNDKVTTTLIPWKNLYSRESGSLNRAEIMLDFGDWTSAFGEIGTIYDQNLTKKNLEKKQQMLDRARQMIAK